jgi:hypothetical protein
MANLLWLQGGACSGNTMSFLNAEEPSACDLVTDFGINILWHPSLGLELGENLQRILKGAASGEIPLDVFVFEGTVVTAPNGTGNWNRFAGRPMKEWVDALSKMAGYTVAIGDCATWGGIPATEPNPTDSVGLQYLKRNHGGFLVSKWGVRPQHRLVFRTSKIPHPPTRFPHQLLHAILLRSPVEHNRKTENLLFLQRNFARHGTGS